MKLFSAKINKKQLRKNLFISLTLILALSLIAYGSWGLWKRYRATNNPNPVVSNESVTDSTDEPDETPPDLACSDYKVTNPGYPRLIEIPKIGVKGCIQRVGIDQNNAVAVPGNVHVAGWYINSPAPGDKGVSLIDGHVQGRYSSAIFGDLDKLEAGDIVNITKGDDSKSNFEVVDVESYSVDQATQNLFESVEGVDNQLTLITCGGSYDSKSRTYDERVIVRAKLVN